ncbi:C-type natriuretic peptide 2 [Nothobranchius furzeri]|uniref:C-type natriuretic peptide 2 n=1 Tax=Nothobranchius furzeri TaxID=105023 RepID=UPI00077D3EE1
MAPSSSAALILLFFFSVTVEMRPSPHRDGKQVSGSLFSSHLTSLIMAQPTSDDITEGSANEATTQLASEGATLNRTNINRLVGGQGPGPGFLLDFLKQQTKTRGRSRKTMFGGRGCFGMKIDRIGSISGLGC